MATNKTKIILDSDVVIHFMKGGCFAVLFDIFPNYKYIILDVVYNELSKNTQTKKLIDNFTEHFSKRIQTIIFNPPAIFAKEYALLTKNLGKGESACMIYCCENKDVLASSNLKDIKEYCTEHEITYLTTLDFLYYAYSRHIMTKKECDDFIDKVIEEGSKIPRQDITMYCCRVQL